MYRAAAEPSPFVVVTCGHRVVAHDRRSGLAVWELVLDEINVHHGGVRCAVEGERVVAASTGPLEGGWTAISELVVTCVDYRTGTAIWEHRLHTGLNAAHVSPAVLIDGGQVLVTAGQKLYAIALEDGTAQWSRPLRAQEVTSTSCGLALPGVSVHTDRR